MGILDAVHDMQKRWETSQRRMIPGSLGGRTESASPAPRATAPAAWRGTDPRSAPYALYEDSAGTSANNFNSTRIPFDTLTEETGSHGITVGSGLTVGMFTLPPGLYTVAAGIWFAPNATGFREIHVTGTVSIAGLAFPPKLRVPAIATGGELSNLAISVLVRSTSGADQLWIFGLQNSGGALNVGGQSIAFLRHS